MKSYLILTLFCLLAAAPSRAAESVFLSIRTIQGEVQQKGREGWMEIYGFSHEILSPRDAASGLPTGRRQHSPFRAVLRQSQATPLLMAAQSRNEVIPEMNIYFFRPTPIGAEEQYYTITLTNARVVSTRAWNPNKQDRTVAEYIPSVEVSFTYQTITWTYEDGGITHEDSWETPVN